ncbi:MAG TPA: hypothetical protein VGD10_05860 [Allosphingosinicella sp.]|uniref:hypothetical protein n=1 Tax=Allosphingosinicella sp. TaxID=2823234 RepID=UPI002ED855FA
MRVGRKEYDGTQRVRIGLTGLAFVFILVLLGAIFASASEEEPITANMIDKQIADGGAAKVEAEPKEPLAELGVAPGNAENKSEAAAAE